jgi:hypothetical protein
MSANQPNVGRDFTISILGPTGVLQPFGLLEEFEPRPRTTIVQSLPINNSGIPRHRDTHQGWEGTLTFARVDGVGDRLQSILENSFYAGNPAVLFQITESVRNPDGSTDVFTYMDVVLVMDTGGRRVQNDKVPMAFRFECSQRVVG